MKTLGLFVNDAMYGSLKRLHYFVLEKRADNPDLEKVAEVFVLARGRYAAAGIGWLKIQMLYGELVDEVTGIRYAPQKKMIIEKGQLESINLRADEITICLVTYLYGAWRNDD